MTDTPSADHVREVHARQFAELAPIADQLRPAMMRGESPESLGLVENGLTDILRERGINPDHFTATDRGSRRRSEADRGPRAGAPGDSGKPPGALLLPRPIANRADGRRRPAARTRMTGREE